MKRLSFLVGLLLAFATPNFAQTKTDTIRLDVKQSSINTVTSLGFRFSEKIRPGIEIEWIPTNGISSRIKPSESWTEIPNTDSGQLCIYYSYKSDTVSYMLNVGEGRDRLNVTDIYIGRGRSNHPIFNYFFTSLDVSGCTALTKLYCNSLNDEYRYEGVEYASMRYLFNHLNVSGCTALTDLICHGDVTELDLSDCTSLTSLDCSRNQLTNLDVSKNTALTSLYCSYNRLTSLDISKNTALTSLYCISNQLTNLDVSKNTALTSLDCSYNRLTSLDISKNTALTSLDCSYNQIALSWLYKIMQNFDHGNTPYIEQSDSVTLRINQPLDLSSERMIENTLSTFEISSDRQSLSADYWKENNFTFRFLKPLQYTLTLYNPAIEENASFVWHITVIDEEQEGFFAIQVASNNPLWGTATITGNGVYEEGKTVTITAKAKEGYRFVNWRNGQEVFSTEADTTFTVTKDLDLVAYFEKIPNAMETFTVSLSVNNPDWGIASQIGNGTYDKDEEVSIIAFPETGYHFVNWTKGENTFSTDMIYTFAVTENLELVANFEKVSNNVANEKLQNDNFAIYVQDRTIRLSEARGTIQVFNTAGQCIYNGTSTLIPVPHSGVYIVKVGAQNYKVVVR